MVSPESLGHHWQLQAAVMDEIRRLGFTAYAAALPTLPDACHLRDRWLRCIDEGCPGGVHLAGSGILLGVEEAAKIGQAAGVTAVTSHEECGAAGRWAREAGKDQTRADEYGREFAAELARRLDVSYCHLPLSDMARPSGLHVARVVYYDGTGSFDPARVAELPPGFVISRLYLEPAYAQREVEIAVSIALGPHGFGEQFSPATPLLLIAVGHPQHRALGVDVLRLELESSAGGSHGRVAVDGFVAPSGLG